MSWDAVVAGGGLAGAAAATRLAMAGRRVMLFEREPGPHDKVCGEFLSGEAAAELGTLQLSPEALGAVPIERVSIWSGRRHVTAPLPFPAWGLSRRLLDDRLLRMAARRGVAITRGQAVRALAAAGDGVRLDAGDQSVLATAALLATGKHDVRGWRRAGASPMIGLKLHLRLDESQTRALTGQVELALFDGGYAGLQPIEGGFANLCLLVGRERFASLDRDWRRLVSEIPHLATRLAGAQALHARPLAVAGMPYGYRALASKAPVYRIGDQAAVTPSFTGDGMAMALYSARHAAECLLNGESPERYYRRLAAAFRRPMRLAAMVAHLANAPLVQRLLVSADFLAPWLIGKVAAGTRVS